jgi:hypothetical protein
MDTPVPFAHDSTLEWICLRPNPCRSGRTMSRPSSLPCGRKPSRYGLRASAGMDSAQGHMRGGAATYSIPRPFPVWAVMRDGRPLEGAGTLCHHGCGQHDRVATQRSSSVPISRQGVRTRDEIVARIRQQSCLVGMAAACPPRNPLQRDLVDETIASGSESPRSTRHPPENLGKPLPSSPAASTSMIATTIPWDGEVSATFERFERRPNLGHGRGRTEPRVISALELQTTNDAMR